MRELKDYCTLELYNELCTRSDVFSCILWLREDVEKVVREDKVDEFVSEAEGWFSDCSTEHGWETMYEIASYKGMRKED